MNVSNEQQVAEETVVRVLRATHANDVEAAPTQHSQQTKKCPSLARFTAVLRFGESWSREELKHMGGCAFCKRVYDMFATATSAAADAATTPEAHDTVATLGTSEDTHLDTAKETQASDKPRPGKKQKPK